jgi:hypothetical protein
LKEFSVTQVLSPYQDFSMISEEVLQRATDRGTEVHAACSAYALGAWVRPLKEDAQPYFDSFKAWFDGYVHLVILVEKRLYDHVLGFHGRLDFCFQLKDFSLKVVDIKTPVAEQPTWKAQLSAYNRLIKISRSDLRDVGSMSLRLDPKGGDAKAVVYEYSDDDWAAFLSALNAYRYFKS